VCVCVCNWCLLAAGVVVSGVRRMNEVKRISGPVSTGMGDRLQVGIPSRYVTSQLGQLSLASIFGWGKGGNVTSVGWQVTQCDPMWHVSSRSGVADQTANCYIRILHLITLVIMPVQ